MLNDDGMDENGLNSIGGGGGGIALLLMWMLLPACCFLGVDVNCSIELRLLLAFGLVCAESAAAG